MEKISVEKKYYPLVRISNELLRQFNKEIPFTIEEPKEPYKPYKEDSNIGGCLLVPVFFIIISLVAGVVPIGAIMVITGLLLIAIFFYWIKQVKESNINYYAKQNEYSIKYSNFCKEKEIWNQQKRDSRTPEKTRQYRLELILASLEISKKPNQRSTNQRGLSEDYFENYLNKWFERRIFKGYSFITPEEYQPYQPDFIYQDNYNLHIDIEIDEPYIYRSKIPIHYIDNIDDFKRDDFFLNQKGWIVIRFAEEQVVKYPNECCKVIAKAIYDLTNNDSFLNALSGYGELQKINNWTIPEANEMANNNYRNSYLSDIPQLFPINNYWNDLIKLSNIPNFEEYKNINRNKIVEPGDDLPF